jgi:hypothetical protein
VNAKLTSGERMVFAVAFDRALRMFMLAEHDCALTAAAHEASAVVVSLREARREAADDIDIDDDTRAMLADMLSTGADR